MISLLIETSTERGCIALMRDDQVILHTELPSGYQNSKYLLPEIKKTFEKAELTPKDLDFITVGIGPGSYTGIRIAAVTAKTIAFAADLPLVGISTLEGFVPDAGNNFAAIIDAKIGGVYVKVGREGEPRVVPLAEAANLLKDTAMLVTPNAQMIRPKLEALYPQNRWQWVEKGPDPVVMTRLALGKYAAGDVSRDGHMELLYLRKTQAEIERDAGHG